MPNAYGGGKGNYGRVPPESGHDVEEGARGGEGGSRTGGTGARGGGGAGFPKEQYNEEMNRPKDGRMESSRGGRGGRGVKAGIEPSVAFDGRGGRDGGPGNEIVPLGRGGPNRGGNVGPARKWRDDGSSGPVDYSQMKPEFPHERVDVVGQYGPNAAAHVDAYWEYKKIVGDDDNGTLFTPEEYAKYKREVIPKRLKNRLFVSWVNPDGMDCKCVGPETLCRCGHRYHQHKTDLDEIPKERPILLPCQASGCRCKTYNFVPKNGGQSIRCRCKHFTEEHDIVAPFPCRSCKDCKEFKSSFTDNCQHPTHAHYTLVETRAEREARGHPVGPIDVPYKAMGALTGFTALSEGYERLDESGIGRPSESLLDAPITSNDHPFLRMHAQAIHQRDVAKGKPIPQMENYEATSGFKRPGETDMDFFERRYQERLRAERGGGGGGPSRRAIQDRQPSSRGGRGGGGQGGR